MIPVSGGLDNVQLNLFAKVTTRLDYGELMHRNGIRTISIPAELERGENVMAVTDKLRARLDKYEMPEGVMLVYGREYEDTMEILPNLLKALMLAVAIIFFIVLAHYKKATLVESRRTVNEVIAMLDTLACQINVAVQAGVTTKNVTD